MNTQSVSLDVSKRPNMAQTLYLGQGDKNGTTLNASIYENGIAFSLSGKSVRFAMRSPKSAGYYEVDGTVSGNVATFAIDETYAATVAGTTDCAYVEILEGDTIIASTNRFRVVVLENATENTDPNGAYTNGVQRFLDDAQEQLDDAVADSDAAAARAIAAAEAAEGAIIDVIPTMSTTIKGGAKLGDGLRVDDDALSIGNLVHSGSGAEVVTDGCAIYSVEGEGWAEQTVTTGKNLFNFEAFKSVVSGFHSTLAFDADGFAITSTDTGACTSNSSITGDARIAVTAGQTVTISWKANNNNNGVVIIYGNNDSSKSVTANNSNAKHLTYTVPEGVTYLTYRFGVTTVGDSIRYYDIQLELGSTPTSYEPYSGGVPGPNPDHPFPIEVCRGRNLLDTANVLNAYINSNSTNIASSSSGAVSVYAPIESGSTYTYSRKAGNRLFIGFTTTEPAAGVSISGIIAPPPTATTYTFTAPSSVAYVFIYTGTTAEDGYTQQSLLTELQLELGSTPTPYVPYGHVGLEVTHDGTTTVTPIPLPLKSDGERWAGGLPDGTADTLTIDSAGRWEWTNRAWEKVFDGSESGWTIANSGTQNWFYYAPFANGLTDSTLNFLTTHCIASTIVNSNTTTGAWLIPGYIRIRYGAEDTLANYKSWLATHNVTVLYPLATPTTESGYIDLPALPEGATVSIPELESIGVSWFVAGVGELVKHAENWHKREDLESRVEALEAAIAELATA